VDENARSCGHWHYYYTAIGDFLVIFNSSVNFVIYIFTNRNFRQGLMLMQTAASMSARDEGLRGLTDDRGRRGAMGAGVASPAVTEYIGLGRRGAGAGSTAMSSGELTAAAVVTPQRGTALPPISEHSSPLARHTATGPSTRYFEPKILLL